MQWYTSDGRQQQGPFSEQQLLEAIAAGRILGGSGVAPHGGAWQPIEAYPPFAHALAGARARAAGAVRPAKKKSSGAWIAVLVALLVVVPVGAYFAFSGSASGTTTKKIKAEVTSSSLSKDEATLTVKVHIKNKGGLESGYISAYADTLSNHLELAEGSDTIEPKKNKLTLKFKTDNLLAGHHKVIVTLSTLGDSIELPVEIDKAPKLSAYGTQLRCEGRECSVAMSGADVSVTAPAGTKVTVDGQKYDATGTELKVPVDFAKKLAAAPSDQLTSTTITLPVELEFKDGLKLAGQLTVSSVDVGSWISAKLNGVKTGKVAFGGDDAAPSRARGLAFMDTNGYRLHGRGTGLASIDLVAFSETMIRSGSCGSYRNSSTGEIVTVAKEMFDHQITVYDRRSGSVKSRRTITAPPPECPQSMSAGSSVSSFASDEEQERYLDSLVGG
jgi:hypothetical protein